jgi:hypothetical protein
MTALSQRCAFSRLSLFEQHLARFVGDLVARLALEEGLLIEPGRLRKRAIVVVRQTSSFFLIKFKTNALTGSIQSMVFPSV